MLFNSYVFILFFLPLALTVYFLLNHFHQEKMAELVLIAMSLWFYAYFRKEYVAVLLVSILVNYVISKMLLKIREYRKALLLFGIVCNISVIFYYKYFDFFLENVNFLFHTSYGMKNILLPLGISFFTFQQISYLVDSYRYETVGYSLTEYALFVSFFPQLIAGPIVTHDEMIPQFRESSRKKFHHETFALGVFRFSVGLSKKVLLADTLGAAAEWGYSHPGSLSAASTIVLSLIYMFQLYFDFSGYCDMACGIANMFNIQLPINFNSPYKAVSIKDFWNRWHMTLSRFLKKYVYFPLGGSRKGKIRTYLNIFLVFLVSGIWHGANWTYILWGIMHGVAQVFYKVFGKIWDRLPKVFRWLGTFIFADFAWIMFRANSLTDFKTLMANIFTWKPGGISRGMIECFDVIEFTYLEEHVSVLGRVVGKLPAIHMWIVLAVAFVAAIFGRNCYEREMKLSAANAIRCIVLLVWSVLSLSGISTFLYFNF